MWKARLSSQKDKTRQCITETDFQECSQNGKIHTQAIFKLPVDHFDKSKTVGGMSCGT